MQCLLARALLFFKMLMRYLIIILLLAGFLVSFSLIVNQKKAPLTTRIHQQVEQHLDGLKNWYQQDWLPALEAANEKNLQESFLRGRKLYKKGEWAIDYFFPATAKELNGAPLPEIEAEEHIVIDPAGFQVMEELIYPYKEAKKLQLVQESKKWFSILARLNTLWAGHRFRDDQVLDALKQEIQRITALGLSGFDTPLSLAAVSELQYSLEGIEAALHVFETDALTQEFASIKTLFKKGYVLAKSAPDFNAFNRMNFILQVLNPLGKNISQLQKKLRLPLNDYHAVRSAAATFFDSGAFNANFFTPDAGSHLNIGKIALGKRLFSDPILSSNNTISCATCHKPELAFTDGLEKSRSFGTAGFLKRNTPTLLYAGLQQGQFYDMRAPFLEDQVKNVIDSKDEIHGSLLEAARKLSGDMGFLKSFQTAFGTRDTITEAQIQIALASYVRSLAPFNSKFDRHMRGEPALTAMETSGFNLFMGKAKCGSCHFVPLFNGTAPPHFSNTESEVIGVPADAAITRLDEDLGRYAVHHIAEYKGAFKTPTVRNSARTAPYMHNGVFKKLEDLIEFYDKGGAAGASILLENQTLPADSLQLTPAEKLALISFLEALSDAP
jgi:cytochrome c peroxidase